MSRLVSFFAASHWAITSCLFWLLVWRIWLCALLQADYSGMTEGVNDLLPYNESSEHVKSAVATSIARRALDAIVEGHLGSRGHQDS